MSRRLLASAVALCVALAPPDAVAAQDFTGAWEVTWAQGIRTRDSELLAVTRWGEARLELVEDGDGLSGTWRTEAMGITWIVTGRVEDGRLILAGSENDSDDPELAVIRSVQLRGTIEDGELTGELWFETTGERGRTRRPWSATRAGSGPPMERWAPGRAPAQQRASRQEG